MTDEIIIPTEVDNEEADSLSQDEFVEILKQEARSVYEAGGGAEVMLPYLLQDFVRAYSSAEVTISGKQYAQALRLAIYAVATMKS